MFRGETKKTLVDAGAILAPASTKLINAVLSAATKLRENQTEVV